MYTFLISFWNSWIPWGWKGRKRAEKREAAKAALLDTDNVRSVGPLLEALWLGDKKLRLEAEQALLRLLPRIHSSDTAMLTSEQRECLNRALHDKNPYLVLAAVQALTLVGDSSALPMLERMAGKSASSAMEWRVRQAAIDCLPFIQDRILRNRIPSTLLRPAKEPMHAEQLLLASQAPGVPSSARRQSDTRKHKG